MATITLKGTISNTNGELPLVDTPKHQILNLLQKICNPNI